LFLKDVVERVASALLIVLLFPVLLIIALSVMATSPGPAIFTQERVGRRGRPFRIWKFRTMVSGAHEQLEALLSMHNRDDEPLFKVPDDPRVTRLGAFLRSTSLDELPQLFNVVAGHMSLVGPRPQVPAEVALYLPGDWSRLDVKPGITGLWQVSGRSSLTWNQAIECDLRYVRDWSLWLDLKILMRTIVVVARRDGAV
jgi:lipopolysaccharide/colanic/teichoic acid biosynthesis glycosyltransferase